MQNFVVFTVVELANDEESIGFIMKIRGKFVLELWGEDVWMLPRVEEGKVVFDGSWGRSGR